MCISRVLRDCALSLSGISSAGRPYQAKINATPEKQRSEIRRPPLTRYAHPDSAKKQRPPNGSGRERAVRRGKLKFGDFKAPIRPKCCFSYTARRARPPFGGDRSGLREIRRRYRGGNLLRIVRRMAILRPPFAAMEYGRVIRSRSAHMARGRYRGWKKLTPLAFIYRDSRDTPKYRGFL